MYAVVEIAGKQFRVEKNKNLKVPLLHADNGSKVEFEKVLIYTDDAGKTNIGQPLVKDMKVSATILEHRRDKKVVVFKKKRRKGYQVKNGHRQDFSVIKIDDIAVAKPAKKAAPKKETAATPKAEVKETKKPVAKKEAASKKPAAAKKATTAKKPAAPKKATAEKKETKPKAAAKKPAKKAVKKEA